ncbi:MAG: chloride channel protein [Candidatus Brocadiaceae bacterium]|nr:chloride channel protein [Candidatus Brocadiaceae bacterium]
MAAALRRLGVLHPEPGHLRWVGRVVLLAGLVGVVAGLGAVAFQLLSHVVLRYGLELIAGYRPGGPAGEWDIFSEVRPAFGRLVPWLILVIVALGGLVSGWIVYTVAPEAEGHGTDAAIRAYHRGRGIIRPVVPLVKIVCSALTLGTGGSGGREGPIALIGAGFGSYLARLLKLSARERRMLLCAGMGAGIAAIFKAPLAGAIFAIEVLYRDEDFEAEALIPAFISCTVAYCVFGFVTTYGFGSPSGFSPLLAVQPGLVFDNPLLLAPLALLAGCMVVASFLYVRCFYGAQRVFKRVHVRAHIRPALGAFLTGLFALGLFYGLAGLGPVAQKDSLDVLSFGYGILQRLLAGEFQYGLRPALVILTAIGLGKIVTTALTIGAGGSGGIFGPSMVIGGTLGGAVGLLLQQWMPGLVVRPDVFVILGMAGFFTAAAKVPLSTIIMVSELTAGYELLIPAMWVAAIAYLLSRGWSIYHEQVPSRLYSPAHQGDFVFSVVRGHRVSEVWTPGGGPVVTFPFDAPLSNVMDLIPSTAQTVFPVLDERGDYYGMFGLNQVRPLLYDRDAARLIIVKDVVVRDAEPLRTDSDLSTAMLSFAQSEYDELPVLDAESQRVVGVLGRHELMAFYHAWEAEIEAAED